MAIVDALLSLPAELEVWLLLGYAGVVLVGARILEALAQVHFRRAHRHGEHGFQYDAEEDHYHCPEGERLSLHVVEEASRVAVYRAPASSCNGCRFEESCAPHGEGRQLYRSLAAWAETDVGRFHQRVSALMFGATSAFSLAGLLRWGGQPGTGLLLLVTIASAACMTRDLRAMGSVR